MEFVIRIREGGKRIGDLDAMSALDSSKLFRMEPQSPCHHEVNAKPTTPMTSIECWDELRDCAPGLVVVRAYGKLGFSSVGNDVSCTVVEAEFEQHSAHCGLSPEGLLGMYRASDPFYRLHILK